MLGTYADDGKLIYVILEALDELDGRMDEKQVFAETPEGWKSAA